MDTADRIFQLLDQLGLEQKKFAESIGATDKIVSKWRTAGLKSYRKYLPQIADTLGTTTEYLLTGQTPVKSQKEAPIPVTEDGLDAQEKELMALIKDLSSDQKDFLLAQLKTLTGQGK